MKDITETMLMFRECARNLWNAHLHPHAPQGDPWDFQDSYQDILVKLFSMFMAGGKKTEDLAISPSYSRRNEPLNAIRIVPCPGHGVPVHINREVPASGYWDHPMERVTSEDADLRFIDFFDFDVLEFHEFEYYRVRIVHSASRADIIGRDALTKVRHTTAFIVTETL